MLVDRGGIGVGTNSIISNGIFAGPTHTYDERLYVKDVLETGKGLNNRRFVEMIAGNALEGFALLRSFGITLQEFNGFYAVKSPSEDSIRGITLIKRLLKEIRSSVRIQCIPQFYVTNILKEEGVVCAVTGFGGDGYPRILETSSAVLATGGAAAIYFRNDNQKRAFGQGYRLASRAGLKLWDMEFVQFYPLVLAQPGLPALLIYPPYPSGAKIFNAAGQDVLLKYGMQEPNSAIKGKRDEFSAILFEEVLKGSVYLDYRKVDGSLWEKRPLKLLPHRKHDFKNEPFLISPAAHFFMGGVRVDDTGQTRVPGLFACGEVVWGLHGANRMRGNALTECLVTGMLSGRSAGRKTHIRRRGIHLTTGSSGDTFSEGRPTRKMWRELRNRLRDLAWKRAGVVRSEGNLRVGVDELGMLCERIEGLRPQSIADLRAREDLKSAAFLIRCILRASQLRKETRGAFRRSDFPEVDNKFWRKNSYILCESGKRSEISVGFREPDMS